MKIYLNILSDCILFNNTNVEAIISKICPKIKSYNKGDVIAIEDELCDSIGIVLNGSIEIQKIFASGKTITIKKLKEKEIFGEVIVFSDKHTYPATIISSEKTDIMFIFKDDIIKLCNTERNFLQNFMALLSNKVLMLNKKLKVMSFTTIRQKIANFLLENYKENKSLNITLDLTKKELADLLGIPRPSLSRELISMKNENIINFSKKNITINSIEKLENILFI